MKLRKQFYSIAFERRKYLGIHLIKRRGDLYTEKYKTAEGN